MLLITFVNDMSFIGKWDLSGFWKDRLVTDGEVSVAVVWKAGKDILVMILGVFFKDIRYF